MKKKLIRLFIFILLLIPSFVSALSDNYVDPMKDLINVEDNGKVNIYFFYGQGCPHCEDEKEWLNTIMDKYKDYVVLYEYESWYDKDNIKLVQQVKDKFNLTKTSVPITIIGEESYQGYAPSMGSLMENKIKEYVGVDIEDKVDIPLLGNVDMKDVSIPLVAVILGFIDGFNPCAMWILLFLINMLFIMKDKKKAWILGFTFLFVSGLVYFLSMIGINFVIGVATLNWMKKLIAIFILVAGILNLRKYLKQRKEEAGCTVVDNKKRKKIMSRMRSIIESKSFFLSMIGITILAASVNLIELACSLGFPLIFTEILTINNIEGITKILYLLIYIFFYMIDDMVVFTISMVTVEATGITNKYNKLCTLVSAIIMILIGILLIFKPDWLMLNF